MWHLRRSPSYFLDSAECRFTFQERQSDKAWMHLQLCPRGQAYVPFFSKLLHFVGGDQFLVQFSILVPSV